MTDRPKDEGTMFFRGMKFAPDSNLKQSDLNLLVPHLLKLFFLNHEGEHMPVKDELPHSMLTLIQFMVDLDMQLSDEAFESIPPHLRKHFVVNTRDGSSVRYTGR